MVAALRFVLVILGLLAPVAAARAGSSAPVLAVLYVDNRTGDPGFDVLHKGLADMLVTDLAAQGLAVVERERLQALIDEQALQQTSFFDPKTAVRVGKGLGATHVVFGALVAMKPQIRIDVRMVDVGTGEVTVTASVTGDGGAFFDLEQQLVARFVAAFERRFAAAAAPQTRVKDVGALLEYSKGLDLADRGELEAAKQRIEQSIRLSPGFALARRKKDEIVARIEASRDRRDALITKHRETLAAKAKATLARADADPGERVAWRDVELQLLGQVLVESMSDRPLGVAALGKEAALEKALVAWADKAQAFIDELDRALAGGRPPFFRARLLQEDEAMARQAGLDESIGDEPVPARLRLARFLLLGEVTAGVSERVTVAPPLGNLERAWGERAWKLMAETDALAKAGPYEHYAVMTLELWADALLLRDRTEDAVAKLQELLDRYPTSRQYARFERRIKGILGLEHDATTSDLSSWSKGLAGCLDMPLRVGLDKIIYRRLRMHGLDALSATAREVEKACDGNPSARLFWGYLYAKIARTYGQHLRCAEFEAWMLKARDHGTSESDIAGWRKNWTKCPEPPPR